MLAELVGQHQVVEGALVADLPAPQVCWAARWQERAGRRAAESRRGLHEAVDAHERKLAIDSEAVLAFHDFIIHRYTPPKDKRLLVFFQCSVRRPFSKSPSHGSQRRAVRVATGCDPAGDFEACPVHVVVLASRIGPVPYELEDVYPANVGGGGVKHFSDQHYEYVRPFLARRMAEYITAHRGSYDHVATFTSGRYGDVMRAARQIAGVEFPIFPDPAGPAVVRMGGSKPRTYWAKYWIQLYFEIVSWLPPAQRKQAAARLRKLDVEYVPAGGGKKGRS